MAQWERNLLIAFHGILTNQISWYRVMSRGTSFDIIIFTSFTHLLMYMRWTFGCCSGMGVVKDLVEGDWWNPVFFFFPFHKYFIRYMLQTCYFDENHQFLYIISYKSRENPTLSRFFLAKNRFLLIFMYIFNTFIFARARWLYDVIVTQPLPTFGGRVTKNTSGGRELIQRFETTTWDSVLPKF